MYLILEAINYYYYYYYLAIWLHRVMIGPQKG